MLRRGHALLIAALALGIACDVFAVRMPTRATAGSSINIFVDLRAYDNSSGSVVATSCAQLPADWVVTGSTYTRTLSGHTTSGALVANAGVASTLNGSHGLAGYTWRCFDPSSATYTFDDFGTAKLVVTVGAAGAYQPRFTFPQSGVPNGIAVRQISVDGLPDWRFDLRPIALPSELVTWSGIDAVTDLRMVAVDFDGIVHQTLDGGGTWADNDVTGGASSLRAVVRAGNTFMAVGASGGIYSTTSVLGTWTQRVSGTSATLNDVCTDGIIAAYVVGNSGYVATSSNGSVWQNTTVPTVGNVLACTAILGGGAWAVSSNGFVFRIDPGSPPTISQSTDVSGNSLNAIAYAETPVPTLIAMGESGAAYQRLLPSGAWTAIASPTTNTISRLRVFGDTIYALNNVSDGYPDNDGAIFASPLGAISWRNIGSGTTVAVNDLAITGKTGVVVGDRGLLLGVGVPALGYDATTLELPRTNPGVTTSAVLTLSNIGHGVLYFGAPLVDPPFTASGCASGALDAGASCDLTVSLTSSTAGVFGGALVVPNNGAVASGAVGLSAQVGADATIVVSNDGAGSTPTTLDFGHVAVGVTATRTVTVRNGGVASLLIGTVAGLVTPTRPFAIVSDGCSGQTLAADATCAIVVSFRPTGDTGMSQSFDIVSSDAAHGATFVQLVGVGTPPGDIRVDSALVFTDTAITDSSELRVSIRNVGAGPLDVQSLSIGDSADFVVLEADAFTVESGTTVQKRVRFAPQAQGALAGTLVIASNDPDHASMAVALSGSGLPAPAKKKGGCSAVEPSGWLLWTLLSACGAYRCASRRRHRTVQNPA